MMIAPIRSLTTMLLVVGATVAVTVAIGGCGPGSECGPGTQRKQLANGTAACVPVDVAKGDTICDADGGVELVAGNHCVSRVQCGPGTMLDPTSLTCVPTQVAAHQPPFCPPPTAGHICVNGALRTLVDGSFLAGQTVRVQIYDPQSFLGDPNPPTLAEGTATDTFMFPNVVMPNSKYILVVTRDPSGAPATYEPTGIGGQPTDGQSVRVDGYVLTKAQVSGWSTAAGINFDTNGALFYRFFNDPPPPISSRTPTETHPVSGVQVIDTATNNPPAMLKYFGASLTTIDTALTATSAIGGAILAPLGINTYTGRGGGVTTWEAHNSVGIANMVQIDFLHPQ
jgi:hypothetical protein